MTLLFAVVATQFDLDICLKSFHSVDMPTYLRQLPCPSRNEVIYAEIQPDVNLFLKIINKEKWMRQFDFLAGSISLLSLVDSVGCRYPDIRHS